MNEKITKRRVQYPKGDEPDYIIPKKYCSYRFALGKKGTNPLVTICMNPSAAREIYSDATINRIIKVSHLLGHDGWMVFNIYPERATDAKKMASFRPDLLNDNILKIEKYLIENNVKEVWGAWGDDQNLDALIGGKQQLKRMLSKEKIKIYYFGTLTKKGNPRHPLQRQEKWDFSVKKYLEE